MRELARREFDSESIDEIRPVLGGLLPGGFLAIRMEYEPGTKFTRLCSHAVTEIHHALTRPSAEISEWSRCGAPGMSLLYLGASRAVCEAESPIGRSEHYIVEYESSAKLAFATLLGWPNLEQSALTQLDGGLGRLSGLSLEARHRFRKIMMTILDAFVAAGEFARMTEDSSHRLSATVAQSLLVHPQAHGFTWPSVKMQLRGQCFALRRDEQDRLTVSRVVKVAADGSETDVFRDGVWQT